MDLTTAAAGLVSGGVVVEVIRRFIPSAKERRTLQTRFTDQLAKRVDALEEQVTALRREADQWRERYFQERETSSRLSGEVAALRSEVGRMEAHIMNLTRSP